jgi:hypothetical protein
MNCLFDREADVSIEGNIGAVARQGWGLFARLVIKPALSILIIIFLSSCASKEDSEPDLLGRFDRGKDLFLAHFDVKTDVDDVHSVAAVATMLADPRFFGVRYHAVAGAYGTQDGLYVPAGEVFELAFGEHWSDAHGDFDKALSEVHRLSVETLDDGGSIWIAEAGQSDFSAALIRSIRAVTPESSLEHRVHVVQHSDWNEEVTTAEDLAFVKESASYRKIPDGNGVGNGSPGFRSKTVVNWQEHVSDVRLKEIWTTAVEIANTYNGADGRYLNKAIRDGGLDFSDVAETAWIFGFSELRDANDFFEEFSGTKGR